jgi:hypothetical protein
VKAVLAAARRFAIPLAAAAIAGCASPPPPAASNLRTVALANADIEADVPPGARCPVRWSCKSHADPDSHRFFVDEAAPAAGKRSLCIERVTHEPWALATLATSDPSLRGARLRFSIQVRVEGAAQGGGPWVLVHGPLGNLHHDQRLVQGKRDWERLAIEFTVAADAQIVEVGATLEGPGRICIDDARLEIVVPKNAV